MCQACDRVIGDIWAACEKNGYVLIVTADHGNAEEMLDEHNKPKTSHTTHFVPLIVATPSSVNSGIALARTDGGGLRDVAPTVLAAMGLTKPVEMTGESMIKLTAAAAAAPASK
jgi:2,3-bisphosphoglycerate-independent phosphoglycerate mutase